MKVVYAPGVFDLLHAGHRNFLQYSKEYGDYLIAAVITDDGAEAYKRRPVQDQETRLGNVRDLRYVDLAIYQPGTDPTSTLHMLEKMGLKPDVLTHGDDWSELLQGQETLERMGIVFALVPYTHGISTTEIIGRMEPPPPPERARPDGGSASSDRSESLMSKGAYSPAPHSDGERGG